MSAPPLLEVLRLYKLYARLSTFQNWPFTEDRACTPGWIKETARKRTEFEEHAKKVWHEIEQLAILE